MQLIYPMIHTRHCLLSTTRTIFVDLLCDYFAMLLGKVHASGKFMMGTAGSLVLSMISTPAG